MKFLILPSMEHVALKDIDHVLLANYFAGLRDRCGYWTMKKIRMLLKSIFEEAANDDLIAKNPMRRLPLPNTADADKPVLEKADAAKALIAMESNRSRTGIRDYAITRIGTFCAVRSAEVFGLRWECDLRKDLFIKHSAWEGKLYERHTKKAKPRKVAIDKRTRQALDHWKERSSDTRPEALMFPSEKSGVPFTSRNWLERICNQLAGILVSARRSRSKFCVAVSLRTIRSNSKTCRLTWAMKAVEPPPTSTWWKFRTKFAARRSAMRLKLMRSERRTSPRKRKESRRFENDPLQRWTQLDASYRAAWP